MSRQRSRHQIPDSSISDYTSIHCLPTFVVNDPLSILTHRSNSYSRLPEIPQQQPIMVNVQLKRFRLQTPRPTAWDGLPGQKTTKTTLLGTMSWLLVAASLLSMVVSSLLIANGSCSQSRGSSGISPVCVGGQLLSRHG